MTKEPRRRRRQQDSELVMEPPRQANLQFVDDTWERLLNALERLEQAGERFTNISARRLDSHPDRDEVREHQAHVEVEVHLQVKCLQRVVHPVRDEAGWLIEDFLCWLGGRGAQPLSRVDEYAKPILQCILGEKYALPELPRVTSFSERDVLDASQNLSVGMHRTDQIVEQFLDDPERAATRHQHRRGTVPEGLRRLADLPDDWLRGFIQRFKAGDLFKKEPDLIEKARQSLSKVLAPAKRSDHAGHGPRVVRSNPEDRLQGVELITYRGGGGGVLLTDDTTYGCPACGVSTWCKAAVPQFRSRPDSHELTDPFRRVTEATTGAELIAFDFACAGCDRPVRVAYRGVELRPSITRFEALYVLELR